MKNVRIIFLVMAVIAMFATSCKKEEPKDPIITWENPADISEGTLLSATQLNATADAPGTFVYTPAIGTKLSVGASQVLSVTFTPTDAGAYNTASKTVIINVTKVTSVTDIDGNVYKIVTIGTQTWMAENLKTTKYRDGSPIPNVTDKTSWKSLTSGACCWYNDDAVANKATYGALYNWYTVADSRNIAPAGWHVPTEAEWNTLITFLGDNQVAGGLMKETGTIHWKTPNTGATNQSGFTALPSGYRDYDYGSFNYLGIGGMFWSSTQSTTPSIARYRSLLYNSSTCDNLGAYKQNGYSVRCVKD
jgi:uncharacterized protein (TIGR02145 family)